MGPLEVLVTGRRDIHWSFRNCAGNWGGFQIFNQSLNWQHHVKNSVEIGHLTKYDAFRVNRDQVMDLEIWFKNHTNVPLNRIFYKFCKNCKILSYTYYLKEAEMKIGTFAHFKEYHGKHKNFKSRRKLKSTSLNMIFHVVVWVYRLVKIWNSPHFPAEFRNG